MSSVRNFSLAAVAMALISFSVPSHAIVISSLTNNPYSFSWSFASGTGAGTLSGTGSLSVSGFNSSSLTVAITLNNTSGLTADRLTAFGFGIDPNATGVTFVDPQGADGGMIDATLSSIPSLATIEVCAWGGVNCAGGSNGGILGGGSDAFSIILAGTWGNSVDIAPIGFKYQTDFGSWEFTTTSSGTKVPEPASTLVVLGLGLLGVGFMHRRKHAA